MSMHGKHGKSGPAPEKAKDLKGTFRRLFGFMKPYKAAFTAAVVMTILATLFNTLGPYVLGLATDTIALVVTEGLPFEQVWPRFLQVLGVLAGLYLLFSLFKYASLYVITGVSQRTMYDLRKAVDDKMKKLPLKYFDDHTYGDILSRMTNDVDTVSTSLQQSIDQMVSSVTSIAFILTMMLTLSPFLTVVGLCTVPLTMLASALVVKKSQKFFTGQQASLGEVNGYVEEMYNGHNIIKAFGREEEIVEEFDALNEQLYQYSWKAQFLSGLMMPISQFLTNVGYAAMVVLGALMIIQGRFSIGKIQSFIQYLRQFSMPVTQTAQIATILQSTAAAAERIFEFLDEEEEPAAKENAQFPEKAAGNVKLSHVRFGYSEDKVLIHDLNIQVKSGETAAIVGPTGAGKTTLVNLLMRFYDIQGGSIEIDGVNILDMKREKLRSLFGMVLQDTWLFTGTIMENIRYGRLDATDEEVYQAAKAAHADGFIRTMPGGYHMMLNEGASNLSQGERQLLTIARAILSNPSVLILDEATSSVDTRTEAAIQKAMGNLMEGRTSFVIAHRLSTIRDADIILFMYDGDIKETGTHQQLLEKGGYYANLYNSQFAENNKK